MRYPLLAFITVCCLLLIGCQTEMESANSNKKTELVISAAVSLQDALKEMAADFEDQHANVKITFNFGSSGALKQQISQGANVDLFLSAAKEPFDQLVQSGDIDQKHVKDLIQNELVLIVPKDHASSIKTFHDLTSLKGKIALGTPESVPAGTYGKETFTNLNIWEQIKRKVVYAKDVRQVLSYVETGSVEAGIVYKTDALVSKSVRIVDQAKKDLHSPIVYPIGIVKETDHMSEAKSFFNYLQTDTAASIFKKYGFQVR
ncbi:molybdate ABC transporter substrate-binding protein [Bacillus sp. 179-C3.3 HS]|uniref:molybdate ABC transporter substrate-binding protein n=1 Tax=Bacillus sp. 179-C3.3 HS TaxID=3232162 RepID=UPI0039A1B9C9